jgi:hypothetical protein
MMRVWAFPRHRPQVYAPTGRTLAAAQDLYSYGRELPTLVRLGISKACLLAGVRRLVSEPAEIQLPMSGTAWRDLLEAGAEILDLRSWALFRSSWRERRFLVFAFDAQHRCAGVIHVFHHDEITFHPTVQGSTFRIPEIIDSRDIGEWHLRAVEPLPALHRPHPWDPPRLREITADVASTLADSIERPIDTPETWVPIHGDLTPWNLRIDRRTQAWLLDWEWASWGPRAADLLRYALTHRSLDVDDPAEIHSWITRELTLEEDVLADAAVYWLTHRIYRSDIEHVSRIEDSAGVKAIRRQSLLETQVLEMLAGDLR